MNDARRRLNAVHASHYAHIQWQHDVQRSMQAALSPEGCTCGTVGDGSAKDRPAINWPSVITTDPSCAACRMKMHYLLAKIYVQNKLHSSTSSHAGAAVLQAPGQTKGSSSSTVDVRSLAGHQRCLCRRPRTCCGARSAVWLTLGACLHHQSQKVNANSLRDSLWPSSMLLYIAGCTQTTSGESLCIDL